MISRARCANRASARHLDATQASPGPVHARTAQAPVAHETTDAGLYRSSPPSALAPSCLLDVSQVARGLNIKPWVRPPVVPRGTAARRLVSAGSDASTCAMPCSSSTASASSRAKRPSSSLTSIWSLCADTGPGDEARLPSRFLPRRVAGPAGIQPREEILEPAHFHLVLQQA